MLVIFIQITDGFSSGGVRYRQIPCVHWKAIYFESQLVVLVASLLFVITAWPRRAALSCQCSTSIVMETVEANPIIERIKRTSMLWVESPAHQAARQQQPHGDTENILVSAQLDEHMM